jgi:hypothetical protein
MFHIYKGKHHNFTDFALKMPFHLLGPKKVRELQMEVDSAHNEARGYSAELFRVKGQYESCNETIESLRRENKNLAGKQYHLFFIRSVFINVSYLQRQTS